MNRFDLEVSVPLAAEKKKEKEKKALPVNVQNDTTE